MIDEVGNTSIISLVSGEVNDRVDAGYIETPSITEAQIQGLVFEDRNGNGINDDDAPIAGIELGLFQGDDLIESTQSVEDGSYAFSELAAGNYTVQIIDIQEYNTTLYQEGSDSSVDSDFDLFGASYRTISIALGVNQVITSIDAGLYREVTVTGSVWLDENGNGIRDAEDGPFEGATIFLMDEFGTSFGTTSSSADGTYSLSARPNQYMIGVNQPTNFTFTVANQGTDETLDSDMTGTLGNLGVSDLFTLASGESLSSVDAGLEMELSSGISVCGLVWEDDNGNGFRETLDLGISDVEVRLYDTDSMLVDMVFSDQDGAYCFQNVNPGEYFATVVLTDEQGITRFDFGIDDTMDSDFFDEDMFTRTENFMVAASSINNLDAGIFFFGSLGDLVWNDLNMDGIQDMDEPGLEGVQVILFNSANQEVGSVSTDANGNYIFEGLSPGSYRANFVLPVYYLFSEGQVGSDGTIDSDIVLEIGANGTTNFTMIRSGVNNVDIDAGTHFDPSVDPRAFIFGFIWEDLNADGTLELTEPGTNGLSVQLHDEDGMLVGSTVTTDDPQLGLPGYYEFDITDEGSYYVSFEVPDDVSLTDPDIGLDELEDSDAMVDGSEIRTEVYDVLFGDIIQGVNCGYFRMAAMNGFVWLDDDMNGIQNDIEEGLPDFFVRLFDEAGEMVMNTTSDSDGIYAFSGLRPGNYYLQIDMLDGFMATIPNVGLDDSVDSDIDNTNGFNTTATFLLPSGMMETNWDIGIIEEPSTVGNRVWEDLNGDAIQTEGEPGINDIVVTLYTEEGTLVANTITSTIEGEDGMYFFNEVESGKYYVQFELPDGYLFVRPFTGTSESTDSNVSEGVAPGATDIFQLTPGIPSLEIDAGIYKPSTIGDQVWEDMDQDGRRDSGEFGVPDVALQLYREGEGMYAETITDTKGEYVFEGLPKGTYYVSIILDDDMQTTVQNEGSDEFDSDANDAGNTEYFDLDYHSSIANIDIGIHHSSGLIGREVWLDSNGNGLKDFDEIRMEGIDVFLLNDDGIVIATTQTDHAGQYTFKDLITGDYQIQFEAPAGYEFTKKDQGFNEDQDSDVAEDGMSDMLSIDGATHIRDLDAGIIEEESFISINDDINVTLFPNPFAKEVNVTWESDDQKVLYRIFDQQGRLMEEGERFRHDDEINNIDLRHLKPGAYDLYMYLGNKRISRKIIKL